MYLLSAVFLTGANELVEIGLLPGISAEFEVSVSRAQLLITVLAAGMVIGALGAAGAMFRPPRRITLATALLVLAVGAPPGRTEYQL
ncbi:hypothetical protein ACIPSJ_51870 [Streptomyces sp. NPDC090088]|uniref:hypothetical protein n=1 Tax=Streptomyces sp. NPDC090088 TaxID=3365944 RepID=UPI0038276F3D